MYPRKQRWDRFNHLPDGGLYVYVVGFSNGIVKVGSSARLRYRMRDLQLAADRVAVAIVDFAWFQIDGARGMCREGEARVVRRLARIANPCRGAREFFSHTRFPVARQLCEQMTKRADARY